MDFNTRNNQKLRFAKIRDLYLSKKYDNLIKEATIYLEFMPNELNVRFMRAKAYRYKGMFKEAIEDLKYNLKKEENAHSIVELYYIYYFLNMYKEALELLPILYKNRYINASSLAISEAIMKKKLNIPFKTKDNYVINQINNYNEELSIKYIINKHQNDIEDDKSKFNSNINIDYLYEIITDSIKSSKKANIEEILEVHYFAISNIGYYNNNLCNFIKVIVIPNTNQIISFYPVDNIFDSEFMNLECDRDKLIKQDNNKVKSLSRIDKFRQKYNM